MHALVLERFGGPFVAKEVPTPAIAPHEALVRVRNVGVCGTDVKIRANRMGLGVITDILVRGKRVIPARASALDYQFCFPVLDAALHDLLGEPDNDAVAAR